jgi:hypothetical protein
MYGGFGTVFRPYAPSGWGELPLGDSGYVAHMGPLVFTFSLDAAETVRATDELAQRRRKVNTFRIVMGALVVSTISAIAVGLGPAVVSANVGVLTLMILFELGWPRYLEREVRKFYRATPALAGDQRYVFDDDGLTMSNDASAMSVRWSAIQRVAKTKEFYLLYYSPKAAYYLPRRAVAQVNREEALLDLLHAKLGEKGVQL